jgi:hypothetical protein
VVQTGFVYFMGSGARNLDGLVHARVEYQAGRVVIVGFEDLFGGGDLDYNDNRFLFQGDLTGSIPGSIPEPSVLALLGVGFICFALVRRRKGGLTGFAILRAVRKTAFSAQTPRPTEQSSAAGSP